MHFLQRAIIYCLYGLKQSLANLVGLSAALFVEERGLLFPTAAGIRTRGVNVIFTDISAEPQDGDFSASLADRGFAIFVVP